MNSFMMRPRALKAGHVVSNMAPGVNSQLAGVGWGEKMILNPLNSSSGAGYRRWSPDRWGVLAPGIYRVVATGGGGGGGAATWSVSPGVFWRGYGGKRGAQVDTRATLKESSLIQVAYLAAGGEVVNPSQGGAGSSGATTYLTAAEGAVSAGGGAGGAGSSNGSGATLFQSLGETGSQTPTSGQRGMGGDGGSEYVREGYSGGQGDLYLELVG